MLLIPVKTLNYRVARNWTKQASQQGPYIYKLADREVINNKPHICLTTYQKPMAQPTLPSFTSLFGSVLPSEESEGEEDG